MLNELAKQAHENAKEKGWHEKEVDFPTMIALCHSELSEALEEFRNDNPDCYFIKEIVPKNLSPVNFDCIREYKETDTSKWDGEKLEGTATELADCIIRILDYCGKENIDIDTILKLKMEYNKTRPYRHGGKVV